MAYNAQRLLADAPTHQSHWGMIILITIISLMAISIATLLIQYILFRNREKSKGDFNAYTTSWQAINGKNLTGKYAIVTGCNDGIGKETVKVLVGQGCNVIMACHHNTTHDPNTKSNGLVSKLHGDTKEQKGLGKTEKAKKDILDELYNIKKSKSKHPSMKKDIPLIDKIGDIIIMECDLNDLASIKEFAQKYKLLGHPIDYLINNAGVLGIPKYETTKQGFEKQWGINHLGHYYLTRLLLPIIIKTSTDSNNKRIPRIINLSSISHDPLKERDYDHIVQVFNESLAKHTFMPPKYESEYEEYYNYGYSKTSNILFTRSLSKRYKQGTLLTFAVHPGYIFGTNLWKFLTGNTLKQILFNGDFAPHLLWENIKTISTGASTTLRCVSIDEDEILANDLNGKYLYNCQYGEGKEHNGSDRIYGVAKIDRTKHNDKLSEKLWEMSEILIKSAGFTFDLN